MHVMIFGCGYSGTAIAKAFAGQDVQVSGTTRSAEKVEALRANGIEAFLFDGETMGEGLGRALVDVT
ncbi:NAD(P)-dependent oxidoreductase, partial [Pseudomonas sp. BGM005]|nr:NAD(P)-dependent oxidoreductase [Pseudomonas sp. BG5]